MDGHWVLDNIGSWMDIVSWMDIWSLDGHWLMWTLGLHRHIGSWIDNRSWMDLSIGSTEQIPVGQSQVDTL